MMTAALWLVQVTELTAHLMSVRMVVVLLLCQMGTLPLMVRLSESWHLVSCMVQSRFLHLKTAKTASCSATAPSATVRYRTVFMIFLGWTCTRRLIRLIYAKTVSDCCWLVLVYSSCACTPRLFDPSLSSEEQCRNWG